MSRRRATRVAALAAGLALVVAACRADDNDTSDTGARSTEFDGPETTTTISATAAARGGRETTSGAAVTGTIDRTTEAGSGETASSPAATAGEGGAMTVTLHLDPRAVWDDGTRITIADLQCTLDAVMSTPGSLTTGYDTITSLQEGTTDGEVVISFAEPYAGYKELFGSIIKAGAFADCMDVSADLGPAVSFAGRPYEIDSWSLGEEVLVANEAYWGDVAKTDRVVMVPRDETALLSGEVDFVFRQAPVVAADALAGDPNVASASALGTSYEGLYFQQLDGPFADDDFRQAFAASINRDEIKAAVYDTIYPGGQLLNCGVWVPTIGDWCDSSAFGTPEGTDGFYDPAAAEQILSAAGWARDAGGYWTKDGAAPPTIRWMVTAGDQRREATQALVIPQLRAAGFDVVADNCDEDCVFRQRLPTLDYDLTMYINTAQPDPSVTRILACDAIPTPENNYVGQNSTGWCNDDASALMAESDRTVDVTQRAALIHEIAGYLATDAVMLPLYQFPTLAAWNTTRVGGPVGQDGGNDQGLQNIHRWDDVDGDGQIVVGVEQWPECASPITDCTSSAWCQWSGGVRVLPGLWDTTCDGGYVPSDLLVGEPEVRLG